MCHIFSRKNLYSLLRASPRFYQVFKIRRDYHLTQLAVQHSRAPANAWDTLRASQIRRPPSAEDIEHFLDTNWDNYELKAPVLPADTSISMISLNTCIEWFIFDFAQDSLANLNRLVKLASVDDMVNLRFDPQAVQTQLSEIEIRRIARAFYRFETFRLLFPPSCLRYEGFNNAPQLAVDFLNKYDPDEIEEIVSVRDYIVRRLWRVFDKIEDDFVRGVQLEAFLTEKKIRDDDNSWFGEFGKWRQDFQMEYIMSLGLEFLRRVFVSDHTYTAELVISNRSAKNGFLTNAIRKGFEWGIQQPDNPRTPTFRKFTEDLARPSSGWNWGSRPHPTSTPGSGSKKGCRDWGYVFWDDWRLKAAGVFADR